MELTRRLILTGGRAGTTCELRKIKFNRGVCVINGPEKEVESLCRYMARVYKAFPEGSTELAFFQRRDKEREYANGAGKAAAQPGSSHKVAPVPSGVLAQQHGSAEDDDDDGDGADAAAGGRTEQHANGNGNGGTDGDDDYEQEQTQALQRVILGLDAKNDDVWTADGKPRIDAVAAASNRQDLTRKVVEAAMPGYVRPSM